MMFVLSIAVAIASNMKGSAVFDPTWDAAIYGFTVAFDIPYIINLLIQFFYYGNLPFP
jgi:hypothetical protein